MRVWRALHLGCRSKIRLHSDLYSLRQLTPRLHFREFFLTSQNFNLRVLFLAGSGSLRQSSTSSLGSWENISTGQPVRSASAREIKALVHGQAWFIGDYLDQPTRSSTQEIRAPVHWRGGFAPLLIPVKALLDMTHKQCPWFIMVTVGMVVGMAALKVTGKKTSLVRSQIFPLSILIKKDSAFRWQNLPLSEGLRPTPVGRVRIRMFFCIST